MERKRKLSQTYSPQENMGTKKHCKGKHAARDQALGMAKLVSNIVSFLPYLSQTCARRVAKIWLEATNILAHTRNSILPKAEQTTQEIILWEPDQFGNHVPVISTDSSMLDRKAAMPQRVVTVHPLFEQADHLAKSDNLPGSYIAAEPPPLRSSFKIRLDPASLIYLPSGPWRNQSMTQPPCCALPELDLQCVEGISLGMLQDRFRRECGRRERVTSDGDTRVTHLRPSELCVLKVEIKGIRKGGFWHTMAQGKVAIGSKFEADVHGY